MKLVLVQSNGAVLDVLVRGCTRTGTYHADVERELDADGSGDDEDDGRYGTQLHAHQAHRTEQLNQHQA